MAPIPDSDDRRLDMIIRSLYARFGRIPTENEVMTFLFGSVAFREKMWAQKGMPDDEQQ